MGTGFQKDYTISYFMTSKDYIYIHIYIYIYIYILYIYTYGGGGGGVSEPILVSDIVFLKF